MKLNLKRTIATLAGVAALATIVPVLTAPAALAAPTPSGTAALTPTSGDSSTSYTVAPPAGSSCPGDGGAGWRVTSYVVPIDVDPATLTFNADGPVPQAYGTPQSAFRMPLLDLTGTPYVGVQPANADPTAPDPNEGKILAPPAFTWSHYGAQGSGTEIPPGAYNIGIACVQLTGTSTYPIDKFWNNTVTVTASATDTGPGGIAWAEGAVVDAVPAAPTLDSVTPGSGTIEAAFTHAASTPPTTGYTVTATPTGGGTPVTATGTASPITVSGLTNGTEYTVTVRATNAEGDSAESNALTATPADANQQPAVEGLTYTDVAPAGSGEILVDWNAPSTGETPTGYQVMVDGTEYTTTAATVTEATIAGLTPGTTYEITVTPLHATPFYGTAASIDATPMMSGVTELIQNVTVTRPAGAVVFTQICEDSATGTPLAGATFGNAPCAIAFGTATRVIPGSGTPYYEAEASLNNVQVDSNGEDTGWTVTGQMTDFTKASPGGDSFSGDQLGWDPAQVSTTTDMTVVDGGVIAPGTPGGLSDGETLASAAPGSSLGIAEIDADLTVQFPITKRAGLYTGTLTMTATPSA